MELLHMNEITKEFLDTVAKNNNGLRAEPKIHYSDEDAKLLSSNRDRC